MLPYTIYYSTGLASELAPTCQQGILRETMADFGGDTPGCGHGLEMLRYGKNDVNRCGMIC